MRRAAISAALVLAFAPPARAEPGDLSLGLSIGVPGQGSGLALGDYHIPGGLGARYELAPRRDVMLAVSGGAGTPIAGVGLSLWAGLELRRAVLPELAIYATPGLRGGFVGTGYYARHSGVFVGYAYLYSGPMTIAPRLPVGLAMPAGRAELYGEAFFEVPVFPAPELVLGADVGFRVRL